MKRRMLVVVPLVVLLFAWWRGWSLDPNSVRLATGPKPEPIFCNYLSYGEGELTENWLSGVQVTNEYETYTMTWPEGFTARRSGGRIEVLSPNGTVWATSGRIYRFHGPSHPIWTGPGCFEEIDSYSG